MKPKDARNEAKNDEHPMEPITEKPAPISDTSTLQGMILDLILSTRLQTAHRRIRGQYHSIPSENFQFSKT